MECTICLESIDERTGSATLSCNHSFHFGCLARWILKTQSCPYCRHETNAFETIHQDEEPDDESDYESTAITEEEEPSLRWVRVGPGHWRTFPLISLQIPEFNEEDHALWVFRSLFQDLGESETSQPSPSEKTDQYIPYSDVFHRVETKKFDIGLDRGYESA